MLTFNQLSVEEKIRFLSDVKYLYIANNINGTQWGLCHAVKLAINLWFGEDINMSVKIWMGDWWYNLARNFHMRTITFCRNCTNKECCVCMIFEGFWWPINDIEIRVAFINHAIKCIIP